MKLPARDGFTLIELVITLVIIGILAAFATSMLWRSKDRGLEAAMQSDLRSLVTVQENYFERNSKYADDIPLLPGAPRSNDVDVVITYGQLNGWAATSSHVSVANRICGIRIGEAPLSAAPAAVNPGIVQCTTE